MRTVFLLLAFSLGAAEVRDLGVLSPRRGVVLELHSTRSQFLSFKIEFIPEATPTNLITVTTTNQLLRVEDIPQVPSGRGLMGVKAIYADDESRTALFRYDLRRSEPPAPSLTPTAIGTTNDVGSSLTNEMRKIREGRTAPIHAPLPPGFFGTATQEVARVILRPLPNATNWTYSQHLDWLADRPSKRRSE